LITIDHVASSRKKSSLNFDKMTDRYLATTEFIKVPSPDIWVLRKNFYFLLKHSVKKQFNKKYIMKPSYMSFDEYGTVILENVLMYMNNVLTVEDFNLDYVIVPNLEALIYISVDNYREKSTSEMPTIDW